MDREPMRGRDGGLCSSAEVWQPKQRGVSLVELVMVVAIALIVTAFAVPSFIRTLRSTRSIGDARDIHSSILLAKMKAAANFSRARVRFDITARTFRLEIWDKTNNCWKTDGAANCTAQPSQRLSTDVRYGTGSVTASPGCPSACVQTTFGQAIPCRPGTTGDPAGGADIASTACITFNSRGIPVDNTGAATSNQAVYITDAASVYGSTVLATGLIQPWRITASDTNPAHWQRR